MALRKLTNPVVRVNNATIAILPNTFEYEDGTPDVNVESNSTGGNTGETVHSEDASTLIGLVKFKLSLTPENDKLTVEWKANTAANEIQFFDAGIEKVLSGASYAEGRSKTAQASEGGVEPIFKGDPIETI
jgi:hypothetical protein